jgi:hypothetical protein
MLSPQTSRLVEAFDLGKDLLFGVRKKVFSWKGSGGIKGGSRSLPEATNLFPDDEVDIHRRLTSKHRHIWFWLKGNHTRGEKFCRGAGAK